MLVLGFINILEILLRGKIEKYKQKIQQNICDEQWVKKIYYRKQINKRRIMKAF